ncbi:MAG: lysylphosphatidylglycerol synthase transmembrane domain-containing protein, partial [Vicinamibacteria bacterium]
VSAFFANFLPSNVGGDVVRAEEAARAAGSRTASLTVAVVDRIAGFIALYFIAVPAYFLGGPLVQGLTGARLILLTFTALVLILGGLFLFPGPLGRLIVRLRLESVPAVQARVLSLQGALTAFRADKTALGNAFLLSLVLQFLGVLYFYFVARALRIPLDLGTSLLMVPLCTLIQALPISFNGWGLREGVYVLYFRQVGLSKDSALAFSIVAATLVMLLSTSGLFVWLGRRKAAHETQSPPPATT